MAQEPVEVPFASGKAMTNGRCKFHGWDEHGAADARRPGTSFSESAAVPGEVKTLKRMK